MNKKCCVFLVLASLYAMFNALAEEDMKKSYQGGKDLAEGLHSQLQTQLKTLTPQQVPGFVSDRPPQSELHEQTIAQATAQAAQNTT